VSNLVVLHKVVEAFRARDVSYRQILQHLPAAIYTTDADGRLTYFNDACVEFSGRTPVLGDDSWCVTWKLYHNDGTPLPHDQCPMAVALRERRPVHGTTAIAERPDGTRVSFMPFPTPLFDGHGNLLGAVNMLVDLTDRLAQEAHLKLVSAEANHRANNLLAVIRSLISLSNGESVAGYKKKLKGRLDALATANSLIMDSRWCDVDLLSLVHEEMKPFDGRVEFLGEPVALKPRVAQSLAMMLHELATNAVKYGALSQSQGRVAVRWWTEDGIFTLKWQEFGGPPTVKPSRKGLGSRVIASSMQAYGGIVSREWRPDGLVCVLTCDASKL
jgi:PAS domain S-box-containing protein